MRGLSADEIVALREACKPDPHGFTWHPGDADEARWDAVHSGLVERGCMVKTQDDDYEYFDVTDLGRLALRVSVQP